MLYKRFSQFITEKKAAQTAEKEFDISGRKWEKQGGAKLKNKCSQYTEGSARHMACMYGATDDDKGN